MALIKIYPFQNPVNYSFNASLIQIDGTGNLIIQNNPGQTYAEDYANDSGFTYDSDKAEFSGGQVQQKSQVPANANCYATFTNNENLNYATGSTAGSLVLNATITNNRLQCINSDYSYCEINPDLTGLTQQGAIRFKYTPNYSGIPAGARQLIDLYDIAGSNFNLIRINHDNAGKLVVLLKNNTGATIGTIFTAVWLPTQGQEYEIELNFDFTAGSQKIFVDGILKGSMTQTGTRVPMAGKIRVMGALDGPIASNGSVSDLIIYNAVQHTSNYTPGYTLQETIYAENSVTLPNFVYSGVESLQAFTAFASTETSTPKYILNNKYWNGSAWVTSDGTYSQSNISADVNTKISELTVADTLVVKVVFSASSTQQAVSNTIITYTGRAYPTSSPTITPHEEISMEELEGFSAVEIADSSDSITYNLSKDGVYYYHNGAAWVVANGTAAQSNTAEEIEANKATFTTERIEAKVKVFLNSSSGSENVEIDSINISYNFAGSDPGAISKCIVYGNINDIIGSGDTTTVKVYLNSVVTTYKNDRTIRNSTQTITPDADGYWEVELIENENMTTGAYYTFNFGSNIKFNKVVPNVSTKRFQDLGDA